MLKRITIFGISIVFILFGLSSCIGYKHINDFASTSTKSLEKFEDINYSFEKNCIDNCKEEDIIELNLRPKKCDCVLDEKADSITLLIYGVVRGYLSGLERLSSNDLTSYKMDDLNKSLTEGEFGSIKIKKEDVEAYSNITKILLKAFTDQYRQNKLSIYINEANTSFQVLIKYLEFNLSVNLVGKLNVQKQRLESNYFDLSKDDSLSSYEKMKVIEEYYLRLEKINVKQMEIAAYSKGLKKISKGHEKLMENTKDLDKDEVKAIMTQFSSDIKDIISEFNKLNK